MADAPVPAANVSTGTGASPSPGFRTSMQTTLGALPWLNEAERMALQLPQLTDAQLQRVYIEAKRGPAFFRAALSDVAREVGFPDPTTNTEATVTASQQADYAAAQQAREAAARGESAAPPQNLPAQTPLPGAPATTNQNGAQTVITREVVPPTSLVAKVPWWGWTGIGMGLGWALAKWMDERDAARATRHDDERPSSTEGR